MPIAYKIVLVLQKKLYLIHSYCTKIHIFIDSSSGPNKKKVTYVVVVTSSSIQKIHSLVVVEDLVVVEVVVVVEDVVGAGVTGVPVVVSNKNSSRSTALSVTSSNSIVLSSVVSSSISELFSDEFVKVS